MKSATKFVSFIFFLNIRSDLNYAGGPPYPPYHRLYPPIAHQNSPEKACLADVGPITRGQHRFLGPKCEILYCPPDPNIHDITVILCEDYVKKINLPENFPDLERRMYLKICEYCKPVSPTIDLDLLELEGKLDMVDTTPLTEELSTNISSTEMPTNMTIEIEKNGSFIEIREVSSTNTTNQTSEKN